MLSRAIRASAVALICQALTAAPAAAAMIGWEYSGAVSSNATNYGGVSVGDSVVMTVLVDTSAPDAYGAGSGPSLEPCGLYSVPSVTVSFGGLVYQSSAPTMTVNTAAGPGNCGYGPSQDGYVLVGGATGPSPGPLPWRFYAEIRDVPVNDGIPTSAPFGSGVFLDLAYGFFPPSFSQFAMTANLTSVRTATAETSIPEPGTIGLGLVGLVGIALRRARRQPRS
jgi:MYXO-CTERM domain-containing protein